MTEGFTAVETARVVDGLHWSCTRLFAMLGRWAGEADRSDVAVSLATASRHMGWHADDLAALAPDGLLVGQSSSSAASPELESTLDTLDETRGSLERLAITHRVLLARLTTRCIAVERLATEHSDAALTRVVGFMLSDLRRDRDDGETLLERLLIDPQTVERVGANVVETESLVVGAGGLPPILGPA